MRRNPRRLFFIPLCLWAFFVFILGACTQKGTTKSPNLAKQPTLYVVGYAHLDTQWQWDYPTTIRDYITKTMRTNFDFFEKYPHYIFNFSGARRYMMMKEYYPAEYERVKKYVAEGRWFPCGSSMEENDVNSPSAESIIRQILYGKQYFRREFGKTSAEYMLPDCFGFPASLPSILAHCGIKGFSTQKLSSSWQPAAQVGGPDSVEHTPEGIPFNVGIWEGPDGKFVLAALNPGSYGGQVTYDLSKSPPPQPKPDPSKPQPQRGRPLIDWPARIDLNGKVAGVFADYMYYGTGDTGGAAQESSVKLMEAIVTKSRTVLPQPGARRGQQGQQAQEQPPPPGPEVLVGDGPVKVISATAEQMFLDIEPDQISKLPRYKGDLELINHSAGSITSQTYMKRWNRKNEVLADDAEKASVVADWLGGRPYPLERLNNAWTLVMGSQFHDIIPGTSIPKAYEYSWNDEVLAMNQFAGVLTSSTEAIASALNTQAKGTAVVVFNPLNIAREDMVEAKLSFPGGLPKAVRVYGPDGAEVPAQLEAGPRVLFLAKVPSVGYAVYDVQPAETPAASTLKVTESSLENVRYAIKIDKNGDMASIFDKALNKELLSAPARLEIKTDNPKNWPAWNMDWDQQQAPPRAYVASPAKVRIVENGPARVALEVGRHAEGSTFVETIRLSAGEAGNRVEFGMAMDWMTKASHLKAVFPLTASNQMATYNWDIGTIERPTDFERQFEVASHQWIDLTDKSGSYGVTVLTDSKNASDKPDDSTLRLTLVRTPGVQGGYTDQGTLDLGHHEFIYGLAGHGGDFRQGKTDWQGFRLNQPLAAFISPKHDGALGKTFSLMNVSSDRIRVLALKKAEQSDEVVIRLVEMDGKPAQGVRIRFASPLISAREINGAEEPVANIALTGGELAADFKPFEVRSFALKLGTAPATVTPPQWQPVSLSYDLSVSSQDNAKSSPGFDASGRSIAAEMLRQEIAYSGFRFKLGPAQGPNAVVCRGQSISLPAGKFTRLYLLAASAGDDQKASFRIEGKPVELTVQDWGGYIGQWDNRKWNVREEPVPMKLQAGQTSTSGLRGQPRAGRAQGGEQAAAGGRAAAQTGQRQGTQTGRVQGGQPQRPRMRTVMEYAGLTPGFIKRSEVAWFASHRHTADGENEPYSYSYLFAYACEMPENAKTLTLPNNDKIRVLAVTVIDEIWPLVPAQPLYDTLEREAKR
jgi:alpha-mannosidase